MRKFRQYLIKAFKIISILLFLIIFLPFIFILILGSYVLFNVKNINRSYKEELLPVPPSREKIIYNYYYRKGADFYIFYYDRALKLDKFKLIKKNNKKYVKDLVSDYYDSLDGNEKILFNIHIRKDVLYRLGNLYYYDKKDKILLIAIENKIYYFRKKIAL